MEVFVDEPCRFRYAKVDTYSGSGRFSVVCDTGGRVDHRDGEPVVELVPIPQPCKVGATVSVYGYNLGTGGAVIAGGTSGVPSELTLAGGEFTELCDPGSSPAATLHMGEPVNYSATMTYTGTVRCIGANVTITSLTATPWFGYPNPSAGSASCNHCRQAISVSGTVPAEFWVWEVRMDFDVTRRGHKPVQGLRIGRYFTTWNGNRVPVCPVATFDPTTGSWPTVADQETCLF